MLTYFKKLLKKTVYKSYLNHKGSFKYFGESVFFPKHSTTFNLAIKEGIYEQDILKFLLNFIKEDSTYIDIGTNIGLMSIPVLARYKNVKVLSFEASPNTFGFLKKTWECSAYKSRWSIYNKAISDNNAEMDFFTAQGSDGAYESLKDTKRINFLRTIKVPGVTIDEIWTKLGKPPVSVIKSDIEGADLLALRGGLSCIGHCRPVILVEWNKINIKPFQFTHEDLLNFCKTNQYNCYAITSLVPVSNIIELELHSVVTENFVLIPELPG